MQRNESTNMPQAGRQRPGSGPWKTANRRCEEPTWRLLDGKSGPKAVQRGCRTARRLRIACSGASINLVPQDGKSNWENRFSFREERRAMRRLAKKGETTCKSKRRDGVRRGLPHHAKLHF